MPERTFYVQTAKRNNGPSTKWQTVASVSDERLAAAIASLADMTARTISRTALLREGGELAVKRAEDDLSTMSQEDKERIESQGRLAMEAPLDRVKLARARLVEAQREFEASIREAQSSASLREIGEAAGLSHQRVWQMTRDTA